MAETYDYKGKMKSAQRRVSELEKRLERNKEYIPDRGIYYYSSRAVRDYVSALKNLAKAQRDYERSKS